MFLRLFNSRLIWSCLGIAARLGGNLVTLPMALRLLSKDEIGLWYLFIGIGALAMRLDFGLGPTTSRSFGYALAGAEGLTADGPRGASDPTFVRNFVATVEVAYTGLAVLLVLVLAGFGMVLLVSPPKAISGSTVWISAAVYGSSLIFGAIGSGRLALATGADQVVQVQRLVFLASIVGIVVSLLALLAGYGLVGLAMGPLANSLIQYIGGRMMVNRVLSSFPGAVGSWSRSVLAGMWPQMWRTGFMGLGAYLIYYANTFFIAGHLGLGEAGSWGLSYQIAMLVVSIGCMPVMLSQPRYVKAWAIQDEIAAWQLFRRDLIIGLALALGASISVILLGPTILSYLGSRTHLIPTTALSVLLVISLLEANHVAHALLVTSRGTVPFLWVATGSGLAVFLLAMILVPMFGVWGALAAQGLVQLAANNWYPVWYAYAKVPKMGRGAL